MSVDLFNCPRCGAPLKPPTQGCFVYCQACSKWGMLPARAESPNEERLRACMEAWATFYNRGLYADAEASCRSAAETKSSPEVWLAWALSVARTFTADSCRLELAYVCLEQAASLHADQEALKHARDQVQESYAEALVQRGDRQRDVAKGLYRESLDAVGYAKAGFEQQMRAEYQRAMNLYFDACRAAPSALVPLTAIRSMAGDTAHILLWNTEVDKRIEALGRLEKKHQAVTTLNDEGSKLARLLAETAELTQRTGFGSRLCSWVNRHIDIPDAQDRIRSAKQDLEYTPPPPRDTASALLRSPTQPKLSIQGKP